MLACLIMLATTLTGQAQQKPEPLIDTAINYESYFPKVLPILGKAFATIEAMGMRIISVSLINAAACNEKYDQIASISFDAGRQDLVHDSFKHCVLLKFENDSIYLVRKSNLIDNWKTFATPMYIDGMVLLPGMRMNDSASTKAAMENFSHLFSKMAPELPKPFYNPFNAFNFILTVTRDDLSRNTGKYYCPSIWKLEYLRSSKFLNSDGSKSPRTHTESLHIYMRTGSSSHMYDLSISLAGDDFLQPEFGPENDHKVEILEVKDYNLRGLHGKLIKVKTTAQQGGAILTEGAGVQNLSAVYSEDYFCLLNTGKYVIQLVRDYPCVYQNQQGASYELQEIDELFGLVLEWIYK